MIYGLIAAAGWGVSSVAAAQAARRMGTLAALLISQATGTVALLAVLAVMRPHLLSLPSATMWGLAGAGFFSLVGWLTYYRALEHGPVGIVSGAAATYGGVTALLALLVLGEPLGRYVGLGDALAVAGVAAAAMQAPGIRKRVRAGNGIWAAGGPGGRSGAGVVGGGLGGAGGPGGGCGAGVVGGAGGPGGGSGAGVVGGAGGPGGGSAIGGGLARHGTWAGVMLAIVSAVTYGTGAFWLGTYAASAGWLVSALVVDIIAVTVLAAALICKRERPRAGIGMAWAIAAGLAESAALVAFARGGQAGQIAITAAVSSTYPLIPLAFGLVLFRERLSALQVMGVCVAVTGLTLVSMSSGLV
jgi:drug/metabolite transporter (DMT)-like permease